MWPTRIDRFTNHAVPLFEKHGMQLVGFWQTVVGPSNHELTYLLAFEDANHRDRAWAAFMADPAWIKAKAESETNGPLVADVANRILTPAPFSPLQ
jgi:hypothetical protein